MAQININVREVIDKALEKLFNEGFTMYICFQAENNCILGVASSEERAKKICSQSGDSYFPIIINKDYGREVISSNDIAVYNIDGVFIQGYTNVMKMTNNG